MAPFPGFALCSTLRAVDIAWRSTTRSVSCTHICVTLFIAESHCGEADAATVRREAQVRQRIGHSCQQHDGLLPPLQAAGPRLPDPQNLELPGFDLLLAEQIYLDIAENEGREEVEWVVRRTIEQHPVTWLSAVRPWATCGRPWRSRTFRRSISGSLTSSTFFGRYRMSGHGLFSWSMRINAIPALRSLPWRRSSRCASMKVCGTPNEPLFGRFHDQWPRNDSSSMPFPADAVSVTFNISSIRRSRTSRTSPSSPFQLILWWTQYGRCVQGLGPAVLAQRRQATTSCRRYGRSSLRDLVASKRTSATWGWPPRSAHSERKGLLMGARCACSTGSQTAWCRKPALALYVGAVDHAGAGGRSWRSWTSWTPTRPAESEHLAPTAADLPLWVAGIRFPWSLARLLWSPE